MQQDNENQITLFAKTNFRNKQAPFGIKREDRRKHIYLIGKTGMGKTTLMENMIIQDILNDNGIAFVDPHGDSVEKILNYIPSHRVNDVVYFNPSDMDFPIAFNILESVDPRYKHLVASGLMGVFTKIWANLWSARMEYILNNAILALLDSPGNTLLGISRMLIDKKYRKRIVDNIKDPIVKSFWQDEFANWNEKYRMEAIAPIQNKVGQFLSSGIIRNIVGQPRSTVDLRELMDNKKILLMNLSKGRVGEDNSALLGAMIITKLQLAALSRVDIPEEQRNDFYLYVDEFQNFATESFATILSEARKYRLNLVVGHQYIGQLINDKNTKVRDAVFGNVGTIICFRIGAADAEFLEKEFYPTFTENDLVNIPKHTIILRLMINGVASDPFTAETLPPTTYQRTNNAEKIIRVSRERYANPSSDVEQKITKWMGQDYHEQAAIIASNAQTEGAERTEDSEEEARPVPEQGKPQETETAAEESAPQEKPVEQKFMRAEAMAPESNRHERPQPQKEKRKHGHNKPKRDNPVWNEVAKLSNKGQDQAAGQLIKSLENIKVAANDKQSERSVLRPGKTIKLDDI
ncbi:type IV secretion system DNA-binding domain-containing protein [Patescibacteria group bacterium]|nr:type IV secretion system DNA-binding domain-containing protein [Patescibacteria group bacterium]